MKKSALALFCMRISASRSSLRDAAVKQHMQASEQAKKEKNKPSCAQPPLNAAKPLV